MSLQQPLEGVYARCMSSSYRAVRTGPGAAYMLRGMFVFVFI